jgi:hypothetical protein
MRLAYLVGETLQDARGVFHIEGMKNAQSPHRSERDA